MDREATKYKYIVLSKRLVIVNSMSSVIARLLNITIILWMYQFLLSRTSTEEFAVYPVIMALMSFAPLFFSLFTGGVSRYIVDAYARGQIHRVREIVSSMVPLLAGYSLIFVACGLIFAFNIAKVLTIKPAMIVHAQIMLSLLLISFTAQMVLLPFSVGFHVKQQFALLNLLDFLRDVLRIILLFVLLLGISASVLWIVVATVISDFVYIIIMVLWSRNLMPELRFDFRDFSWKTAIEMTSFGFWTTVGRLGDIMYTNAATIMLNKLGSALDVTNYYLGVALFHQMQGLISVALLPLQPVLTSMNSLQDYSRLGNTFLRGGRYALWVLLIIACPIAIFSKEFIQLYVGEDFIYASYVIKLFMIMFPFTQATALLPMIAIATGKVKPFFLAAFIAQFIGLILMLYFIGHLDMGAIGATLALTVITIGSQLLYFWWLSLRIVKISGRRFLHETLIKGFTPACFGLVVWVTLRHLVMPASWTELGLCFAGGAIVYVIILLIYCIDISERNAISEFYRRFSTGR